MLNDIKKKSIWIGMFILFMGVQMISSQVMYTPTTKTECNNGICNKLLHSGTTYVYEDDQWKGIANARSLKDKGFEIVYLEEDKDFPLEVLDFNLTSMKVKLKKWAIFNTDIPLKVLSNNKEVTKEKQVQFNIFDLGDKEEIVKINIGEILKFGYNSTEVILRDINSELIEDSYIDSGSPNTNDGADSDLIIARYSILHYYGILKFNMSSLPNTYTIENASLIYYLSQNSYDNSGEGFNLTFNKVYNNYNWTEETITWNNKPNTTFYNETNDYYLTIFGGAGEPWMWQKQEVTNIIQQTEGEDNLSIYLIAEDMYGTPSGDITTITTKEGLAGYSPYLNITYTEGEAGDTTNPNVTIVSPTATTYDNGTNILYNISATDDSNNLGCFYSFDGGETSEAMYNDSTHFWNSSIINTEGNYTVTYLCYDMEGNLNDSESVEFEIENTTASDSCTYTSGNWNIDCSDNCSIETNINLNGNNLSIVGNGLTILTANITNMTNTLMSGGTGLCTVRCKGGCLI